MAQPVASTANPDVASRVGATTPVAQITSATSSALRSDSASWPRSSRVAVTPLSTSTPLVSSASRTASRTVRGAAANGSCALPTSTRRNRPAKRAASASVSSTPAAPAPTTAMRAPGGHVASSRASRSRNCPIGLTGSPPPDAIAGVPPTLIDSRSKLTGGRSTKPILRRARSMLSAAATSNRAPAAAAIRAQSICAASKLCAPRNKPGSIPEYGVCGSRAISVMRSPGTGRSAARRNTSTWA